MTERTLSIDIDGMSCDGCVASVTKVLGRLPGAHVERVAVGSARVAVADGTSDQDVVRAIEKAGFTARVAALAG
jgi:copper chaperone CopZ